MIVLVLLTACSPGGLGLAEPSPAEPGLPPEADSDAYPAPPLDSGVIALPRFQAHEVDFMVEVDGVVRPEKVTWTWRLADKATDEICRTPLTVLSVTPIKLTKSDQVLAAWTFEVEGGETAPCVLDPELLTIAIAGPDDRLLPALAARELDDLDVYSFTVQRGAAGATTLHGIATTKNLLNGDSIPVEKGPLPADDYRLEPLLYLNLQ
ncbi:MAG: hypothetical protein AAGA48_13205 [Myxococcota bacterium]